jgi:hypothetical protein
VWADAHDLEFEFEFEFKDLKVNSERHPKNSPYAPHER